MATTRSTRLGIRVRWVAGLTIYAALSGAAAANELNCPNFPEPNAKLQWVAPYMLYNGVPMSIKRFDSEQNPADILAFYRRAWAATGAAAPVENTVDAWQTISVVRGKCFFTVQVQAAGRTGSTGMLSATEAPDRVRAVAPGKSLPMMSGSTIINDIEHQDDGKAARTLMLTNNFSAESNADFYRRSLTDQGWRTVSSYQMATKKGPGITLVMKRGLAEASLVITRSGSNTIVLANMVDKP